MSQLHVIIGEDDYRIGEIAKKIFGDGVGLEVVDSLTAGNADLQLADIRTVEASFSTPPFLDPKKVTWWKNVHFLPGGKSSEDVKIALEKFAVKLAAAKLPANQHFILSGPRWLKTSVFAKTLASAAEVVVLAADPKAAEYAALSRVADLAKDAGLSFAPGAADEFVRKVGFDTRSLISEMAKMREYLGPDNRVITVKDVCAISSPGVKDDPMPWSLTDAIGRRDAASALEQMHEFNLGTGFAVFMSTVIERCFRQLMNVKLGRTDGIPSFALQKNRAMAAKWTLSELRVARQRFLNLRERVVSGTEVGDILVETELLRVLRTPAKASARFSAP